MYSIDIIPNAYEFAVSSYKLETRTRTRTILTTTTIHTTITVEFRTQRIVLVLEVFWVGMRLVGVYPVALVLFEHVDRYDHRWNGWMSSRSLVDGMVCRVRLLRGAYILRVFEDGYAVVWVVGSEGPTEAEEVKRRDGMYAFGREMLKTLIRSHHYDWAGTQSLRRSKE
jgi:hypothetical protein